MDTCRPLVSGTLPGDALGILTPLAILDKAGMTDAQPADLCVEKRPSAIYGAGSFREVSVIASAGTGNMGCDVERAEPLILMRTSAHRLNP